MKYGLIALILVLFAGVAYAMSDFIVPKTWNYKITIEIETPEGVRIGSAVRQVRAKKELAGYINPSAGTITYDIIGEAIVVNLGRWGLLFGLIEDTDYILLEQAFEKNLVNSDEHIDYFLNIPLGTQKTLTNYQPKLIVFEDINNPKTIKLLYINQKLLTGEQQENNFSQVYGSGFNFKSATVELTDEPITWKIESLLPWFNEYYRHKGYIGGEQQPPFTDYSKTYVRRSNFKRGNS